MVTSRICLTEYLEGEEGLLPTIRHFENRRGEGPGDEVAFSPSIL